MQTFYLNYFENAWSCPPIMVISPFRKIWWSRCWNQLVGNFSVYLKAKKQSSSLTSFMRFVKTFQTCYFPDFLSACPSQSKIIVSIWRKLSCLSSCKKSASSLTSFLRNFKEIENLFFLLIWVCWATHT